MTRREEAAAILEEMRACIPGDYFSQVDEVRRGIGCVLGCLDRAKGVVYPGDIAREMNVSTARIAAMLNRMEKGGLIRREPAPEDARRTVVTLTDYGRAWARKIRDRLLDRTELLLERVGSEDLWEFLRLSKKIKAAMGCERTETGEKP